MPRSPQPVADRLVDRLWWSTSPLPSIARSLLAPVGAAYLVASDLRNRLFDSGRLRSARSRIPVASVGNLTAGGTGKTPVSAWMANQLRTRGARPAIVMRGYGSDEALVHRVLAPATPVVISASRAVGVARAEAEHGCDVAVLDDAFQHRWVDRLVDIVLLGAEETLRPRRGLPAGPWRERLSAVRRATLAIVTRKSADIADADRVLELLQKSAPTLPTAVLFLAPGALVHSGMHDRGGDLSRVPLQAMARETVMVIAAIANAKAFVDQVTRHAARVTAALYPDHHPFSRAVAVSLAARAAQADRVVCTLKDLVKLAPLWPSDAPPLWYVSQEVIIERGADILDRQLTVLLNARPIANETAVRRRPPPDIHGH